jgi:hypothetical protein
MERIRLTDLQVRSRSELFDPEARNVFGWILVQGLVAGLGLQLDARLEKYIEHCLLSFDVSKYKKVGFKYEM